ncbi:hypothetical protein LXL04_009674 [Taraxacum kok-saghyz]
MWPLKQNIGHISFSLKCAKTSTVCGPHLQASAAEEVDQTSAVCNKKTNLFPRYECHLCHLVIIIIFLFINVNLLSIWTLELNEIMSHSLEPKAESLKLY